jgi:uncharacterized membrane protein YhaH (DUF805 family)
MPVGADYPFWDIFGSFFAFFIGLAWIVTLIAVIVDVLRSDSLSGVAKAGWILFIVLFPILGLLLYLVTHAGSMSSRISATGQPPGNLRAYYDPAAGARAGAPPRPGI